MSWRPCLLLLTPLHAPTIILGVEHVRSTMFRQNPFWRNAEDFFRTQTVNRGRTAIKTHPTARAAELVLMEEVVGSEDTLLAVNRDF